MWTEGLDYLLKWRGNMQNTSMQLFADTGELKITSKNLPLILERMAKSYKTTEENE